MQLIAAILKFAESKDKGLVLPPEVEGYTPRQVHYHVNLCGEAGNLHVRKISGTGEEYVRYSSIR